MTDERIDALIRRLDVPSDPDPDFERSTYLALRPRASAARVRDASRIGRFRRDLRLVVAGLRWPSRPDLSGLVVLVVLLLLATLVALAIVGDDEPVDPERAAHRLHAAASSRRSMSLMDRSGRSFRPVTMRRG